MDLAAAMLETDEGKATIQETYRMVQRMGINGIPTYVIDGGRHVLVAVKQDQLIARSAVIPCHPMSSHVIFSLISYL